MKIDCNVARDLIPLTLDGAASEESKKLVEEHIAECPPCATYRDGMQAALAKSEQPTADEMKAFGEAAVRMHRKRVARIWRNVLIGVLLGAIIMLAGGVAWNHLTITNSKLIPLDEQQYSLSRLADGRIVVTIDLTVNYSSQGYSSSKYKEKDGRCLYLTAKTSIIRSVNNVMPFTPFGFMAMSSDDFNTFDEIRVGERGNFKVLYKKGDEVPAASEEMEAYYKLIAEYEAKKDGYVISSVDGKVFPADRVAARSLYIIEDDLTIAAEKVPEWQVK